MLLGERSSSPFGSKAGDAFTRITITIAAIWVLLIMIQVKVIKGDTSAGHSINPTKSSS